eukprot:1241869-Alexandrium_andersonii.AAC.1
MGGRGKDAFKGKRGGERSWAMELQPGERRGGSRSRSRSRSISPLSTDSGPAQMAARVPFGPPPGAE